MTQVIQRFFEAYFSTLPRKTVYTPTFPSEMKASEIDGEGWIEWKAIQGSLLLSDYTKVEKEFGVFYPKSFIEWHKSYYFLECSTSILSLPTSNPLRPLDDLKQQLNWFIPQQLIPQNIYPFGSEGNDTGPLVFDGRNSVIDNEFSIRVYDLEFSGDLEGLSEIIFSSFSKLLECLTHFLSELNTRKNFEIIPEFFAIDPQGAGKSGIDYWLGWARMLKANEDKFGD